MFILPWWAVLAGVVLFCYVLGKLAGNIRR